MHSLQEKRHFGQHPHHRFNPNNGEGRPTMMTDTTTLRTVAAAANAHYWDANALLVAATLMAEKLDDDEEWVFELQALLAMASMKVHEMQNCFNPHIQAKGGATA